MTDRSPRLSGLWLALGAYVWWGLAPVYFRALHPLPAPLVVGWRVMMSVPVLLVLAFATRQGPALLRAARQPKTLAILALSTLLIGGNWLIYIYAISHEHVYAASIGYYLNPLVNIALGTLFLGERLRPRQWAAVALGGVAALVLLAGAGDTLAISVALALTVSFYGMARKVAPVASLPGLTIETVLLIVPSAFLLQWEAAHGAPPTFGVSPLRDALMVRLRAEAAVGPAGLVKEVRKRLQLHQDFGFDAARATFLDAGVNASLRQFLQDGQRFDAIVLDPPKFAPTAAHAERAARAYKDINRLALQLLEPGGVLFTFSCSGGISADLFHKIVASAGADAGVDGYITERLGGAPDHPMTLEFLKGNTSRAWW